MTVESVLSWLKQATVTNWPTKVTALVLATVLWAVVEAKEPTTQLVPVQLEVDVPDGRAVLDPLPVIQALYAGPASELIKLYATPPIIRRRLEDSVTVVELNTGDLVTARDINATPQDVQPRRFTLRVGEATQAPEDPAAPVRGPLTTGERGERVLMGVPVTLPNRLRDYRVDPPAVAVTVVGTADRVRALTRDSLQVRVPDLPVGAGRWVPVLVTLPAGITASVRPDSVRLVARSAGG